MSYSETTGVFPRVCSVAILAIMIFSGCADSSGTLEAPLALFRELRFEESLPLFEQAVEQNPNNADAHVWLAETYRRLGRKTEAEAAARTALDLDSCHSMTHFVLADIQVPSPYQTDVPDSHPNWQHLMKAIDCDSANGNAWMMIMVASIWREKEQMVRRSQRRLGESGFLTPAALAFGRWLLQTLPKNAILFTNGDMDTYPTMALQVTENLRPDVTIIEREWLNFAWGRRWYREHAGLPFPVAEERLSSSVTEPAFEILHGWAQQMQQGAFPRPITFAVTVRSSFYRTLKDRLQYSGPFYQLHPQSVSPPNDLDLLNTSLAGVHPEEFTGPWVSEADYSPIRRLYTHLLAANVTESALVYAEELLDAERLDEAVYWLEWAEAFEKGTELGLYHTERIQDLKNRLVIQ